MSYATRIQQALDEAEANIVLLASKTDKELAQQIDAIGLQSALAYQQKNEEAMQLLEIWFQQVVSARIYKMDNNIADTPNEMKIAIADIETVVAKAEKRQDIIETSPAYEKGYKQKIKEDNQDQMSLF